jgi:hypothetical protein
VWLAGKSIRYAAVARCFHNTGRYWYSNKRFYPEHFYCARNFLLLNYKFFGAAGEARARQLFDAVRFPPQFRDYVLSAYEKQKHAITPLPRPAEHPMIKVLGYNQFHALRLDVTQ